MISTISLNGLLMGVGTNFTLLAASGFSSPRVDVSLYPNSGRHGSQINNTFWRERHISLEIGLRESTIENYAELREQIIQAFSLPTTGEGTLQVNTIDGRQLQVSVQLTNQMEAPFERGRLTSGIFRVELIAADPFLVSQTENMSEVALPVAGGTEIPTEIPLSLSSSGGSVVIENGGNGVYKPTIEIQGPCDTPTIYSSTTDQQFTLDIELEAGDSIVVDCEEETVTLNGTSNQLDIFDGDFIEIIPGNNTISFSASTYEADALAIIYWRQSWIGI